MKILFASSEALPFVASGGLGDVSGSLPRAIRYRKKACRVILPLYKTIKDEHINDLKYITNFYVELGWRKQYCGIFETTVDGVIYYFIDNEYYFYRDEIYGFFDDAERFAFFSRAIIEAIKHINYKPDIIHCNDWQTALVPIYLDLFYKKRNEFCDVKTVFTIHNIQYQGKYGIETLQDVFGIGKDQAGVVMLDDCVNLVKGAIVTADRVTTVSESYAKEILEPYHSHGLNGILIENNFKLRGILNGIDYKLYDPENDGNIFEKFTSTDLSGKKKNKKLLIEQLNLEKCDGPLISIVSRLVVHKGLDLVKYVFEDIIKLGFSVAILGTGEFMFESFFKEMAQRYPKKVFTSTNFNPELAKKLYASSDMFLMPSKSEPCGLAQMISLRYGTIPIVRETGGLKDSVFDNGGENGNGFTFKTYNAHDMLDAIRRAKDLYNKKAEWEKLVKKAMQNDYSWNKSAIKYINLYNEL